MELEEDQDKEAQLRKILAEEDEKKQITRGRMGIMLPERAAFDFVVRPDSGSKGKIP